MLKISCCVKVGWHDAKKYKFYGAQCLQSKPWYGTKLERMAKYLRFMRAQIEIPSIQIHQEEQVERSRWQGALRSMVYALLYSHHVCHALSALKPAFNCVSKLSATWHQNVTCSVEGTPSYIENFIMERFKANLNSTMY